MRGDENRSFSAGRFGLRPILETDCHQCHQQERDSRNQQRCRPPESIGELFADEVQHENEQPDGTSTTATR